MDESGSKYRNFKVHNVEPKLDKKTKKHLEQEALKTMYEIYSKNNQTKKT